MKAMTRQQLADRAGITTKTLTNWIAPYQGKLRKMGMRPKRILPPKVVAWLADRFCIDVDDDR